MVRTEDDPILLGPGHFSGVEFNIHESLIDLLSKIFFFWFSACRLMVNVGLCWWFGFLGSPMKGSVT